MISINIFRFVFSLVPQGHIECTAHIESCNDISKISARDLYRYIANAIRYVDIHQLDIIKLSFDFDMFVKQTSFKKAPNPISKFNHYFEVLLSLFFAVVIDAINIL